MRRNKIDRLIDILTQYYGVRIKLQQSWIWEKIFYRIFKSNVISIGHTIWVPSLEREWLNSNYAFATISHKYIHYKQRHTEGLSYYWHWWCSDTKRFQLELEAYSANFLCAYIFYGEISKEEIDELTNILYENYNFDFLKEEIRYQVCLMAKKVKDSVDNKTAQDCEYDIIYRILKDL